MGVSESTNKGLVKVKQLEVEDKYILIKPGESKGEAPVVEIEGTWTTPEVLALQQLIIKQRRINQAKHIAENKPKETTNG